MVNTMKDLRQEVVTRLRTSLDGRNVPKKTRLPKMLGVTPHNKVHDPNNEDGTLLDISHQFWQDYHKNIRTHSELRGEIHSAVDSLREDGVFRLTESGDEYYCEVDKLPEQTNFMKLHTTCKECGSDLYTSPSLDQDSGYYNVMFSMNCPNCDFSGVYEAHLNRL